jgi:hypothetical protein
MAQTTGRSTVVGVFARRDEAERAVAELRSAGFTGEDIGLVGPHVSGVAHGPEAKETHWETGGAVGAMTGGMTGALLGVAAAAGLLPGVGQVIAGGALLGVLAGAATGAAAGGLLGLLVGLGVPEEHARFYEAAVSSGRTLVTVRDRDHYSEVMAILTRNGGTDVYRAESAEEAAASEL